MLATGRDYPGAWEAAEKFRASRGEPGFDWPDWCFLPMAGAYAVVSGGGSNRVPPERGSDIARVAAMQAWRMTQGIYRFDSDVYRAVIDTPVAGDVPSDVVMRLPEWCVYIETPGLALSDASLHGFFAHLEYDMGNGRTELRLLLDTDPGPVPVPLHLGDWPLAESIARATDLSKVHATTIGLPFDAAAARAETQPIAEPLISLLLYLCSTADYSRRGKPDTPAKPTPKKTRRHGWRLFPADGPAQWDVGVRMGAALRRAYDAQQMTAGGTHAGPRPHVRRAHWHTILSGPRKRADGTEIPAQQRKRELRWMPPIPVNVDDLDSLPSVIRPVR